MLVEGVIVHKYRHLEGIKEEVESPHKDQLREYCHILDDVSHDLVKLLMQLQLKLEVLTKYSYTNVEYLILFVCDRIWQVRTLRESGTDCHGKVLG